MIIQGPVVAQQRAHGGSEKIGLLRIVGTKDDDGKTALAISSKEMAIPAFHPKTMDAVVALGARR